MISKFQHEDFKLCAVSSAIRIMIKLKELLVQCSLF
jgi:hypothetical protein